MNDKCLAVFFSIGISLKNWTEKGLLNREKLIYEYLIGRGTFNKIYLFTYGTEDINYQENLKEGIEIVDMPRKFNFKGGFIIYSFLLPLIHKKKLCKCQILKTKQIYGAWSAVIAKWICNRPLFVRTGFTLSLFSRYKKKPLRYLASILIERFVYWNADYSSVSSDKDYKYIKSKYKVRNLFVNYNYIDINIFKPIKTDYKGDLIFVGRLSQQKNIFNLIKGVAKTPYSLHIYGTGELENHIRIYINDNRLDNIFLKGAIANSSLPEILNGYKAFILPSFYEGMPKTLLEAMSCGLPCIASDRPGNNELIKDNITGVLTDVNYQEIAKKISTTLGNKRLMEKIGKEARKKIIKDYSIENNIRKEEKIYREIYDEKK